MNETEKQIVAWLRGAAEDIEGAVPYALGTMILQLRSAAKAARDFSNAIERGEHRQHSPAKDD